MESIDFHRGPVDPIAPEKDVIAGVGTREHLARSPYFDLVRLNLARPTMIGSHDRFTILIGLQGSSDLVQSGQHVRLEFGQTLLLPAVVGPCEIVPRNESVVLTCVVP